MDSFPPMIRKGIHGSKDKERETQTRPGNDLSEGGVDQGRSWQRDDGLGVVGVGVGDALDPVKVGDGEVFGVSR